ncbi:aspartyl/asparaginyl beta-hydroxylase domain-containing protein [Streptomyces clavifer]|uniref:aspartyl/asparaginyl beta-hydroxylase domain-containing protein n=1 Tax=Streptomyces clavifer TaxID=68188 RepID=UPI002E80AECC|nr:aspartyl/asparaginyl beta-hydroxylase domain-containing protein [Streptomyces clavifer]WRY79843.1 aspartyl/asparaginyl beta-hydroxylase domain-containing protein [Streptomyces clavifer]WRY86475.1 aspartyl/asparaginyl beta-hydroxylase domain-containing protein [Streptomyces clavifer]WUC32576.1 aspartyl/asparaginyl beta-hydroxylase domain-containing protein [Streptomyces clavifer]
MQPTYEQFAVIREEFGPDSLARVEEMMAPGGMPRHPLQAGAKWILPGISQQPWHDPRSDPAIASLVDALENAHGAIRSEHERAWQTRRTAFSDYEHYLTRQDDWQSLYIYQDGQLKPESVELAPTAYSVIRDVAVADGLICPLLESHFSTLLPRSRIAPHSDLWNFSINLHFAVDIPDDCDITVAGETRTWEEGRCLLFDYSFEHHAENRGERPRTCLLVDLWHPETTVPERRALTVLVTEVRKLLADM